MSYDPIKVIRATGDAVCNSVRESTRSDDAASIRVEVESLRGCITALRTCIAALESERGTLRTELARLTKELAAMREERDAANQLADKYRGALQCSNNSNLRVREERDGLAARCASALKTADGWLHAWVNIHATDALIKIGKTLAVDENKTTAILATRDARVKAQGRAEVSARLKETVSGMQPADPIRLFVERRIAELDRMADAAKGEADART